MICTRAFQRRYGLGIARPAPLPLRPYIRSGYVKVGGTIAELARNCGIDPEGLERTVTEYNVHAREGEDPAFGRGSTSYNRYQGDAGNKPNPCVAPIERGPFYAVKVLPGSFGTFAGLKADASSRVLDANDVPIPGLYAAGTDMASVMGGHYPAGGIISEEPVAQLAGKLLKGNCGRSSAADEAKYRTPLPRVGPIAVEAAD